MGVNIWLFILTKLISQSVPYKPVKIKKFHKIWGYIFLAIPYIAILQVLSEPWAKNSVDNQRYQIFDFLIEERERA
jgi:hypothetical protein